MRCSPATWSNSASVGTKYIIIISFEHDVCFGIRIIRRCHTDVEFKYYYRVISIPAKPPCRYIRIIPVSRDPRRAQDSANASYQLYFLFLVHGSCRQKNINVRSMNPTLHIHHIVVVTIACQLVHVIL